ncbi:aspartyl protease family protein [Sphingomonas sp. RHCKR47]|uniref:retroviral-like aspartic protease family protein n=1 Tax=Sphingomonas citricola TaxID=2862498 RepID=UPI001CA4AEDD|nr:retroviral-like aspartic protease family protein [Sphingomonas citricola]MBW6524220.1 aspartyl protease family protein [Sphingomonas citricola]
MERYPAALLLGAITCAAPAQVPVPGPPAAVSAPSTTGPGPAPAANAPAPDDLSFAEVDRRMTVPVQIAGAGPYRFIIDTGAQRSVISRQLARRLNLPAGRRVRLTAMTGSSVVDTVIIPSLSVSTIGGERIEAPALEGSDLGALGLLGIDTLQGHRLVIDFDAGRMSVAPSTRQDRAPRAAPGEIVIQARSLFGQLVVTSATLNGRRVRVVLDTGTSISLGNRALQRMLARGGKQAQAEMVSVLGDTLVADYAAVRELKLGTASISGLPIAFADAAPFRAFALDDKPALFLGMDALKLFRRVEVDFANRELRLLLPRGAAAR